MSSLEFGLRRMTRIRAFVAVYPYSKTSVIARAFFDFSTGLRKCRQVLATMAERKVINRCRLGQEYAYFRGPKSSQWVHIAEVTDFHWKVFYALREGQEVVYYKREAEYPGGRADALYYLKLEPDGSGLKFFLEYDDGGNRFDKLERYEVYAKSGEWVNEFWADPLKTGRPSFPLVLVVSDREISRYGIEVIRVKVCRPGDNYMEVLLYG